MKTRLQTLENNIIQLEKFSPGLFTKKFIHEGTRNAYPVHG